MIPQSFCETPQGGGLLNEGGSERSLFDFEEFGSWERWSTDGAPLVFTDARRGIGVGLVY